MRHEARAIWWSQLLGLFGELVLALGDLERLLFGDEPASAGLKSVHGVREGTGLGVAGLLCSLQGLNMISAGEALVADLDCGRANRLTLYDGECLFGGFCWGDLGTEQIGGGYSFAGSLNSTCEPAIGRNPFTACSFLSSRRWTASNALDFSLDGVSDSGVDVGDDGFDGFSM